jgi:hypothetical protein
VIVCNIIYAVSLCTAIYHRNITKPLKNLPCDRFFYLLGPNFLMFFQGQHPGQVQSI